LFHRFCLILPNIEPDGTALTPPPWPIEQFERDRRAFLAVLAMSFKQKVYMRDAAYMVAIDCVAKAMQLRGCV
jgi:hypothetical protein